MCIGILMNVCFQLYHSGYIYIYSQNADAETLFASAIPGFTESWHGAWCLMPAESDRGII